MHNITFVSVSMFLTIICVSTYTELNSESQYGDDCVTVDILTQKLSEQENKFKMLYSNLKSDMIDIADNIATNNVDIQNFERKFNHSITALQQSIFRLQKSRAQELFRLRLLSLRNES